MFCPCAESPSNRDLLSYKTSTARQKGEQTTWTFRFPLQQSQMAEHGKIVTATAGATGNRGRLTSDTLNLYSTSYKASYGRENFTPRLGHHQYGTGYSANLRPAIFYRPSLDHIDNPRLGLLLLDSFMSQTKRHYRPYIGSDGSEVFQNFSDKPRESGFLQMRSLPKTVSNMSLQTEYEGVFVPHHPTPPVSQNHLIVGRKGESGFTEGTDLQLNTFIPKNSCMGTEALPSLVSHISRETGFTRDTVAPLACPASLLTLSQIKSNAPTERFIGRKERSGFLLNAPNNQTFPDAPFDCSHFLTHYQNKFCDHAAVEKLRSSWTRGGISTKRSNGYAGRDTDR
uniref:stabilizer of axonemal microtubules 4 n=1 Tax=Centroberyx gerrardi TaxID=166262 RepID=UPI003AAC6582